MSSSTLAGDVASYLAAVEALLDDLPDEERRELIEDLEGHLTEVAAEDDGTLTERLGPPDVYTAELRASAGLPPRTEPSERVVPTLRDRVRASSVGRSFDVLLDSAPVASVRTFLPDLKPGWWVLRGYVAVQALDAWFYGFHNGGRVQLIPSLGGSTMAGLVAVAVAMWLSVVLGRASEAGRARVASALASAVVVFAALFTIAPAIDGGGDALAVAYEVPVPFAGALQHGDGAPITHVCAYDEDGERLRDVQLFDQVGRPLELGGGKLDVVIEKQKGEPPLRRKLGAIEPDIEGFTCPKKLEDLQSKERLVERGPIREKLMQDGPLPEKLRPFVE